MRLTGYAGYTIFFASVLALAFIFAASADSTLTPTNPPAQNLTSSRTFFFMNISSNEPIANNGSTYYSWYNQSGDNINFSVNVTTSGFVFNASNVGGTGLPGLPNYTSMNFTNLANGTHRFLVYVYSNDSTSTTMIPFNVTVDDTAPLVEITKINGNTPPNATNLSIVSPVAVEFVVNDTVFNYTQYKVFLDGIVVQTGSAWNGTRANASIGSLSEGTHRMSVEANDSAFNTRNSTLITFTVDSIPLLQFSNRTPTTTVITVGNTSATYQLRANLTINNVAGAAGNASGVTFTVTMPYGMMNRTVCEGGFTRLNTTHVSCTRNLGNIANSTSTIFDINVTANISAYSQYSAPGVFIFTANCTDGFTNNNCIQNTTTALINAVNSIRNPRPEALDSVANSNTTLIITNWNQTNKGYQVQTPMYTFSPTAGRPVLSNGSYGDVMYFDKSMFERPSYMQLWSYNLTFRVVYNGNPASSNASFVFRSPINSSNPALATQGLMVLNIRTMETVDFQSNTTFNMTLGTPAPNGFTVYWNGTNQTDTIMSNTYGVTIVVNPGMQGSDQSINLFTVNVSSANASLINNTDISLLFTMANATACGSGSCQSSPIYVNSQSISGWSPDTPPKFGETLNTSYIINATNTFTNYTVNNLSLSIMQPMNVTMNISGRMEQFNMTKRVKVSVWNGTDFVENLSVVKKESAFSFIDTHGGDANITLYVTVFDILLTNNTANQESLKGWEPNSNATAVINFSAEMTFPVMNESAVPSGGAGATHNYNATINSPQRAPMNLTAKVPGISNSSTGVVVTIDGSPVASSNLTIGSLIIKDVTSGQHIISVTYTVPAASSTTTTTTTSSGGSGSTPTVTTFTNTLSEALADKENKITIDSTNINVEEITLEVTEKLTNVKFTTTKLDAKPSAVAEPTAKAFQYINFTTENLPKEKIKSAKIKFTVLKSWLTSNNYTASDVALYRYTTQWDKLATAKTNESSTEITYVADTPGFSTFVIAAEKAAAATPAPTATPTPVTEATTTPAPTATAMSVAETPSTGWTWLFVIAIVILGAGYMLTKKKVKKKLFS